MAEHNTRGNLRLCAVARRKLSARVDDAFFESLSGESLMLPGYPQFTFSGRKLARASLFAAGR